jgi:predicted N-acetyltransferase YhbS
LLIRAMREGDVEVADRVMRIAFGTFLGASDAVQVFGDAECVRPRFAAAPEWAFVAEQDGEVVGSVLATRWGSFGFFGPLTVRPDLWDRGIAGRLLEPVVELFDGWGVREAGLFTFPQSTKHIWLYQKFGFWPQQLTPVLLKPVSAVGSPGSVLPVFSAVADRSAALEACRAVAGAVFDGLDLSHEMLAVERQRLGDTVLVRDGDAVAGFAVCHCGAGEAGSGACYVKFGVARPGPDAAEVFERLLDACEQLAATRGVDLITAGVNMARHDAYRRMLARGYRARMHGIALVRPHAQRYFRTDSYVIDDLR